MKIRVAVVDDQALVRAGFRLVLESSNEFTVVGEAAGGRAGVALVARTHPDVVLMDVRMPDLDGIAATELIVRESRTRVIVLTTFDSDSSISRALDAGASAFLLKDAHPAELMSTITAVHAGEMSPPPRAPRGVADVLRPAAVPAASVRDRDAGTVIELLSSRELEVLIAIGQGLTNPEIAKQLVLSESTVKTHVGRVLAKLDLRDRIQAVILSHRIGLIQQ